MSENYLRDLATSDTTITGLAGAAIAGVSVGFLERENAKSTLADDREKSKALAKLFDLELESAMAKHANSVTVQPGMSAELNTGMSDSEIRTSIAKDSLARLRADSHDMVTRENLSAYRMFVAKHSLEPADIFNPKEMSRIVGDMYLQRLELVERGAISKIPSDLPLHSFNRMLKLGNLSGQGLDYAQTELAKFKTDYLIRERSWLGEQFHRRPATICATIAGLSFGILAGSVISKFKQ